MMREYNAKRKAIYQIGVIVVASAFVVIHMILPKQTDSFREHREILEDTIPNENRTISFIRCHSMRGEAGHWIQDWSYAKRANYPVYGSYNGWHIQAQQFRSGPETPFRWATSWRWEDEQCPVEEISLNSFCRVSWQLNLTRYLLVGDSLSIQFLFSLLSLLGYPPKGSQFKFHGMLKPFHIPCLFVDHHSNHTVDFEITLWMFRRSPAGDWAHLKKLVATNTTNTEPHHQFVQTNPNRTAVIANAGAWMQNTEEYVEAFDSLLTWLDSFNTEKLMAFFRPTVPGHIDCTPMGNATDSEAYNWTDPIELHQSPYRNYEEYDMAKANRTEPFNWQYVESFNEHSKTIISKRKPEQLEIQWLNIYPSTILRHDGHVGFGDCLHYSMPGPTDWWVHFFFTMLLDELDESAKNDKERDLRTPKSFKLTSEE